MAVASGSQSKNFWNGPPTGCPGQGGSAHGVDAGGKAWLNNCLQAEAWSDADAASGPAAHLVERVDKALRELKIG